MNFYSYETTYETKDAEGNVIDSREVRFRYTFQPGLPARIRYDEHDHPAEAAEVEIQNIHVEVITIAGNRRWFDASAEEHEILRSWAETTIWSEMIVSAIEEEDSAHEAAAEHAYETRRDLERLEND